MKNKNHAISAFGRVILAKNKRFDSDVPTVIGSFSRNRLVLIRLRVRAILSIAMGVFGVSNMFVASPAQADVFSLFGTGAESKAAAGAGQIASRGAPANYYNPANLIESPVGIAPYFAIDINAVAYSFEYPGKDAVKVARTVPIPFVGLVYRPEGFKNLVVGGSFLPIPAGSGKQKIKRLPLLITETVRVPQIVDVETSGGETLGYRTTLGCAYKIVSGLSVGIALRLSRSDDGTVASNSDTGLVVLRGQTESTTQASSMGVRGQAMGGRITGVFTLHPGASSKIKSREEFPSVSADAVLEQDRTVKGPLGVGAALEGRIWKGLSPYIEVFHEQWGVLRDQKRSSGFVQGGSDYLDTTDAIVGATYTHGRSKFIGGYGVYQSHLGQGIVQAESADDKALIGQRFADIDAIPHEIFSLGYSIRYPRAQMTTAVSNASGQRDVWEKAMGYGHYELEILSFTLGWEQQF